MNPCDSIVNPARKHHACIRTGGRSRPTRSPYWPLRPNPTIQSEVPLSEPISSVLAIAQLRSARLRARMSRTPPRWRVNHSRNGDRNRFDLHGRTITANQYGFHWRRRRSSRVTILDSISYCRQEVRMNDLVNVLSEKLLGSFSGQQTHAEWIDKNYFVLAMNKNRSGNASTSVRNPCSLSASASKETLGSLKSAVASRCRPYSTPLRSFRFANGKERSVARRITTPRLRLSSTSTLTFALAVFRSKVHTLARRLKCSPAPGEISRPD